MGEKNNIIEELKKIGITCWIENGQIVFLDKLFCEPNTISDVSSKLEDSSQEYIY